MGFFDGIADAAGDFFGGISGDDISTGLDIANAGISVASGVSGLFDDSVGDAQKAQQRSLELQRELAKRNASIGDEAGEQLNKAFAAYLKSIGSSGFYDPETITQLQDEIVRDRRGEHVQEKAQVENLMEDLMGLGNNLNSGVDYNAIAAGVSPGQYHPYADVAPGAYYDEMGRVTADPSAREGNYDGLVDELSQGFLDRFSDNTQRAVDDIYADQEVDTIRRGMDRSTYDVQSKRAAAAEAKSLYDKDVMKAIDEALAFVGERQGLDTGNQGMRLSQLQGESGTAQLGMGARSKNTSDRFNRGKMQMEAEQSGVRDKFKSAGLKMKAGQSGLMDKLRALEAGQGLMSNAQGLRANQWKTPMVNYDALGKAYTTFGKSSDARRSGLQEMGYTIGKPYEYQSTGVSNAGQLNTGAIQGWNNAFQSASQNAQATNKNLGFGLDQASNINWNSIFGDDD